MSSSLSSSSEFWEVDADRVEKNSSSQLALSSLHVGSVEVANKASTAEGVSEEVKFCHCFINKIALTRQNMSLHLSAQTTRSKMVVKDRTVSVKRG